MCFCTMLLFLSIRKHVSSIQSFLLPECLITSFGTITLAQFVNIKTSDDLTARGNINNPSAPQYVHEAKEN